MHLQVDVKSTAASLVQGVFGGMSIKVGPNPSRVGHLIPRQVPSPMLFDRCPFLCLITSDAISNPPPIFPQGHHWETPLSLTADTIEVDVGELLLDYGALVTKSALALRNLPTGSCRLKLSVRRGRPLSELLPLNPPQSPAPPSLPKERSPIHSPSSCAAAPIHPPPGR